MDIFQCKNYHTIGLTTIVATIRSKQQVQGYRYFMLQEYCFTLFPADVKIGFNPTDYTVSEGGGSVTFLIEKIGSNERDVTVFFSTADGSATGKTTMRQ